VTGWRIGFLLLLLPVRFSWAEEWPVRVLLKEGSGSVRLKVEGWTRLEEPQGKLVRRLSPGEEILIAWDAKTGRSSRLQPEGGLLWVEGRPYRGRIEVWRTSGGLQIINEIGLEEYVRGVMKGETPPDWPYEALKAQATVARTYALYERLKSPQALFHLHATTVSQVYRGVYGEDPRSDVAVQATRGVVLTYRGRIIPAFYHAASGGHTEDAVEVWEAKYPFIIGVEDSFSAIAPHHRWQVAVPLTEVRRALERAGWRVGEIQRVEPVSQSRSGRVQRLRIWHSTGIIEMEGRLFRHLRGVDRLRCASFSAHLKGREITFIGRGWGHGVGLSQWGAKGMADLAYDYTQILKYYFPLAELMRLP
jgi:stage II sporulation protein D